MIDSEPTTPHGVALAHLSLAVGGFALGTGEFASMGLLPNIAADVGVSVPVGGRMISAYALGVVIGAPCFAAAFAKTPRRAILVGLMLLFAVGNIASALATSYRPLVAARFISGLPHGAFFGVAALVAASLVKLDQRAKAVGKVMLGLSVANVIGVPFATWVGQIAGWRAAFVIVAGLALLTATLVRVALNGMPAADGASPLTELRGFAKPAVWLTLGIAAIGFGGLFAVYSYVTPSLMHVTGLQEATVPLVLCVIGLGMVCGSIFGGWLADKGVTRAIGLLLLLNIAVYALMAWSFHNVVAVTINLFVAGLAGVALAPAIQTRLMDVAGDAQTLAASLNHSAFNLANALGAWIGGATIAAGYGWDSTGPVGVVLSGAGLLVFLAALCLDRVQARGERATSQKNPA